VGFIGRPGSILCESRLGVVRPFCHITTNWAKGYIIWGTSSCLDSFLINGRGQRICPDISLLTPFASPVAGPLTDKACPLPNSTLSMGPVRNYTAQYPDQVPARLYQGCSNTSNVRGCLGFVWQVGSVAD
jgi:hypothetical protein